MPDSTTIVPTPTSRCRFGIGRVDITPPVDIYHRFWGAARHDRASGVHRPLTATAMIVQPLNADRDSALHAVIAIDHCLFRDDDMQRLREETSSAIEPLAANITFTFSHTHSGGHICRARGDLPGGELIGPYLDSLPEKIAAAFGAAHNSLQPATFTYAATTCDMGRHRDYWDEASGQYVCGFNPEHPLELPLHVVRVTNEVGETIASVVNYPCHPTTLAWDNTLISPDYVGALREVVEEDSGAPCLFLQAPCGDVGPRDGFTGDVEVADRNGRQVGYAALSALAGMPVPRTDHHYDGPVLSGATIGAWSFRPQTEKRARQTSRMEHHRLTVALPYRTGLPSIAEAEAELEQAIRDERAAVESGDANTAAASRALAERSRRQLERLRPLPAGEYPFSIGVWRLGDAFWVAVEGEPYHALEQELNRRFPDTTIIVIVLANGSRCSYLPTREAYEKPLYQVDVALLEAGCLEAVIDEISEQIRGELSRPVAATPG